MERRDDRRGADGAIEDAFAVGQSRIGAAVARELERSRKRLAHRWQIRRRERFEPRRNRLRRSSARRSVQHGNHVEIIGVEKVGSDSIFEASTKFESDPTFYGSGGAEATRLPPPRFAT